MFPFQASCFVFRTPLLSQSEGEGLVALAGEVLGEDHGIREAVWLGSPEFYGQVGGDIGSEEPAGKEGRRARALYRYYSRMAYRATPFGLFAGYSLGEVGKETSLELAGREHYQRKTRLDFEYLHGLVQGLLKRPEVRLTLRFRVNSSLQETPEAYLYAEGRFNGKRRSYHQVQVKKTPYLREVVDTAREGAAGSALATGLVERFGGVSTEEAEGYLAQLVESQILVPECEPLVTGEEAAEVLAGELASQEATAPFGKALAQAVEALREIDHGGMGHAPARYETIAAGLRESLPAPVEIQHLFQVDMRKPVVTATLGEKVIREILKGVEVLHGMANPRRDDPLEAFARVFEERYGGQEIPLLTALDEEWGVGFERPQGQKGMASPLLEGLPLGRAGAGPDIHWSRVERVLWSRVEEAARSGDLEIELDGKEIDALSAPNLSPLPDAFSVMATLAAPSCEAVDQGNFRLWIHVASGPSGANLLGRFCPMDEELARRVKEHLRAEEALKPGAVFAEIVHVPEGRIGNVVFRPVLRGYEIPFLGRSSAPKEKQIPFRDVLVAVRGGRITLRSRRLGKEVIPRLTTAHNYGSPFNLKAYRFLCQLQHQGVAAGLFWNWGLLEQSSFLPRVRWGRLVFSRARWRLRRKDIEVLCTGQGEERLQRIRSWAEARHVPRFFYVVEGDNELLIDLDLPLAVDTFSEYIKNRPEAVLVELYPGPDELCVEGPEGRFLHELVIPFVRTSHSGPEARLLSPADQRANAAPSLPRKGLARTFSPGSEWLYAKFYCGLANADRLLLDLVAPLVQEALQSRAADGWFFIRYADPDPHLRVRFYGAPQRLLLEVLAEIRARADKYLRTGFLHRLELSTYEREVERYGGPEGMLLCEQLFQVDSEAVIGILKSLSGDAGAQARWKLALVGADRLLGDLGLEDSAARALLSRLKEGYFQEFGGAVVLKKALGDRYRQERTAVETLLETGETEDRILIPGLRALEERSRQMSPVIVALRKKSRQGHITTSLPDLAASLLHMHVNRLVRASARAHEAVLYAFLAHARESRIARLRGEATRLKLLEAAP